MMNKLCIASLGVLLLVLHLSSQMVQAENVTANATSPPRTAATIAPTGTSGSARTEGLPLPLALALALAASLLRGWAQ